MVKIEFIKQQIRILRMVKIIKLGNSRVECTMRNITKYLNTNI